MTEEADKEKSRKMRVGLLRRLNLEEKIKKLETENVQLKQKANRHRFRQVQPLQNIRQQCQISRFLLLMLLQRRNEN